MDLGPIRSIVRRSAAVPSPSICRASASSTAATPSLSGRWQGNMCSRPEWPPLPQASAQHGGRAAGAGGLIQANGSMLEKTRKREEVNDMWAMYDT